MAWADLPAPVRAAVERALGSPVVEAVSQLSGFSPGSADRVVTAAGRRAFVKAVCSALNAESPSLHRREVAATAGLPDHPSLPRLLASFDDGEWVALVLDDVDGREPRTPWSSADLTACLDALASLSAIDVSALVLPDLVDQEAGAFSGWERFVAEPAIAADLDTWISDRLPELVGAARTGVGALTGEALVHRDVRADNLLVREGRPAVVVDWPHAARGAAWFDTFSLVLNVEVAGGPPVEELVAATMLADVPEEDLTGLLAGFASYFTWEARLPPPPGLPNLRGFQRWQADAALRWLRRRW